MNIQKLNLYRKLNKLVHRRFSLANLYSALQTIANNDSIGFSHAEELIDEEDWRIDISLTYDGVEYDGSIWFLKTRTDEVYITEVCVD